MRVFPRLWASRAFPWACAAAAGLTFVAVTRFVELSPRVEADFFFAEDDPQVRAARRVDERFPSGPQIILRVADTGADRAVYQDRIADLTRSLAALDGIVAAYSIATNDPDGPLFGRVLTTPDPAATNVVLRTDGTDAEGLVPRVEAVVDAFRGPGLEIVLSGVPVIVELIRRSLFRDLVVFTGAAVFVFALLVGVAYRDAAIVAGTLVTCALSVGATLLAVRALDVSIGLLTANLVTIVFVLTLSHVVFLTANVRRAAMVGPDRATALARGVRETFEGSFWSMTTTLLGFLSLLVATARPLRELGLAGAVGTVVAMAAAYGVYPAFVGRSGRPPGGEVAGRPRAGIPGSRVLVATLAALVVTLGLGVIRLDTDPSLLSYFAEGSELREGLERIDRDGGSSTLDVVVRDPAGRLDTPAALERMLAYQATLEADPVVGVVLSPAVLVEQARTMPLGRFLPIGVLLDMASSPLLDEVALAFVTRDRDQGLFSLRLRESVATDSRRAVMARVREGASAAGLEAVETAGFYDLQAQLGSLIRTSLAIGITALLVLFLGVAWIVSRSWATTARMWLALAAIPLVVLGTFGWLGIAVDIVTSPAANVALAMGVDSMIHLVVRVRRLAAAGVAGAWGAALAQIRSPVLAASSIICAGFGIFLLSSFPPTRRFGAAVILGTLTAAVMALVVLPYVARREPTGAPEPATAV